MLPQPRDGWEPVQQAISRLALLPGRMAVREELARIFVTPKISWAAPLIEPPPAELATDLRRAVLKSANRWWCDGRWWADRVHLHPVLGTALQACKAFARGFAMSPMLMECFRAHVEKLGLRLLSVQEGLWVAPEAAADDRMQNAARKARQQGTKNFPPEARREATAFRADEGPGLHAARICARVKALKQVRSSRFDAEGTEEVDVEAQSDSYWKQWKKSLTAEETKLLSIWRAGAASTPTRRWYGREGASSQDTCCPFCGAEAASARHLWADCRHFKETRQALQLEFGFGSRWWAQQPRVTAKTGWITQGRGGGKRPVAACKLALRILAALHPTGCTSDSQAPSR